MNNREYQPWETPRTIKTVQIEEEDDDFFIPEPKPKKSVGSTVKVKVKGKIVRTAEPPCDWDM